VRFSRAPLQEYYLLENDLISNKTKKLDFQNKQIPLMNCLKRRFDFKSIQSKSLTILENENQF
jgi:hypothetical protein